MHGNHHWNWGCSRKGKHLHFETNKHGRVDKFIISGRQFTRIRKEERKNKTHYNHLNKHYIIYKVFRWERKTLKMLSLIIHTGYEGSDHCRYFYAMSPSSYPARITKNIFIIYIKIIRLHSNCNRLKTFYFAICQLSTSPFKNHAPIMRFSAIVLLSII